jgi:hypothetical protein
MKIRAVKPTKNNRPEIEILLSLIPFFPIKIRCKYIGNCPDVNLNLPFPLDTLYRLA